MGGEQLAIIILGMPRSGSSMTAGIFHLHGVWVGRCMPGDDANPSGHFENLEIKAELVRRCGKLTHGTVPAEPQNGLLNFIESMKPGNPWMFKCSAMYRTAFNEFTPRFVCVRRHLPGIVASNMHTGFMGTRDEEKMLAIIQAHQREMDRSGGVDVFTDEVVAGDYSTIVDALEYCGLEPDLEKIKGFVNPAYWNRR